MKPCRTCENDDWKFELVDGWVIATCKQCGNTFSFEKKKKEPVDENKPCRKCGSRLVLKESRHSASVKKKLYYFTHTLRCTNPKCRTLYLSEKYKIHNHEVMKKNIEASLELGRRQNPNQ